MVKKGFTLIETMIVLALLTLLASIAFSTHRNASHKAREVTLRHNLAHIRATLDQYKNDKDRYPETLQTLVDEGYLREMPLDPILELRDAWEVIYDSEIDLDDTQNIPGVYDVKSGSQEQALDGTYYYEW